MYSLACRDDRASAAKGPGTACMGNAVEARAGGGGGANILCAPGRGVAEAAWCGRVGGRPATPGWSEVGVCDCNGSGRLARLGAGDRWVPGLLNGCPATGVLLPLKQKHHLVNYVFFIMVHKSLQRIV